MRHTIIGMCFGMMFLIFLACYMTVNSKSIRQNELDRTIDTAVEQTVEALKDTSYSKDQYAALFAEELLVKIESDSTIEMNIMNYDEEKGLLTVEVKEHFTYPNGATGMVKTNRTVVLESA